MKPFLLFLSFTLSAQPIVSLTGPSTIHIGKITSLTISITGTAGQSIGAITWGYTPFPLGFAFDFPLVPVTTPGTVVTGTTSNLPTGTLTTTGMFSVVNAVGVTVFCISTICLDSGYNFTNTTIVPLTDGVITTLPVLFNAGSGSNTLNVSSITASNGIGTALIPINPGPTYVFTLAPSLCDVNGDGKLDSNDVLIVAQGFIGFKPCPIELIGGCTILNFMAIVNAASTGVCSL